MNLRGIPVTPIALFIFVVALLVVSGLGRMLLGAAFVGFVAWWAWDHRAAIREWAGIIRAELTARLDTAPSFWARAMTQNVDHLELRDAYEHLVSKKRTRAETLTLAEVIASLETYGDDPLAKPPRRGFAALASAPGLNLQLVVGGMLLAAIVALWGRGELLKARADQACSVAELEGAGDRRPCHDLGVANRSLAHMEMVVSQYEAHEAQQVASAARQAEETRALNQRIAAREAAAAARRRRAAHDDTQAASIGRAPDWDGRLRDLATGVSDDGGGDPGASPGPDRPGGVSGTGAGPADVSDPVVTAPGQPAG